MIKVTETRDRTEYKQFQTVICQCKEWNIAAFESEMLSDSPFHSTHTHSWRWLIPAFSSHWTLSQHSPSQTSLTHSDKTNWSVLVKYHHPTQQVTEINGLLPQLLARLASPRLCVVQGMGEVSWDLITGMDGWCASEANVGFNAKRETGSLGRLELKDIYR